MPRTRPGTSVRLPDDAPHVAYGGDEVLEQAVDGKILVFFFTYRGIMRCQAPMRHLAKRHTQRQGRWDIDGPTLSAPAKRTAGQD